MTEVSLEGEKYTGIFNGVKEEVKRANLHCEWYEGAGLIRYRPNSTEYFFMFLIPQEFSKYSLEESLKSLVDSSGGVDIFCQSLIPLMERAKEQSKELIPRIVLPA
jgi:hypothetical protein